MTLLESIALTVLVCVAVHVSMTWDGYILKWLGDRLMILPIWIRKPLFECLPCMGFWYTFPIWFAFGGDINVFLLITAIASIGANVIIVLFIRLIEAVENLERFDDELQGTPEK